MHVLVAGAGVLGRELMRGLVDRGHEVTGLALRDREFDGLNRERIRCVTGDVTRPETLQGLCAGVDVVVSCIGITRISSRLKHRDVDYQGNLNLLNAAEDAGVGKFVIVSPEGVTTGQNAAPLLEARHAFEAVLSSRKLDWVIVHSGGFFSDLAEMAKLAKKAPIFLIGNGQTQFTPIAVEDLAVLVADSVGSARNEKVHVGGPETLSWNEIAKLLFTPWGLKPRVYHVPAWVCHTVLALIGPFSPRYYAMGRLIVFMSTTQLATPTRGKTRLADYLNSKLGAELDRNATSKPG